MSSKRYSKIELASFRGMTGIPKQGDYVIVLMMSINQYVCIGIIEPSDLALEEGETMVYSTEKKEVGQAVTYTTRAIVKITKDHEIKLSTIDTKGVEKTNMLLKQDGSITITASKLYLP